MALKLWALNKNSYITNVITIKQTQTMSMTKSKFAILYAQEAMFWKLCSDNEWPESLRAKYRAFCQKVDDAKEQLPDLMNISFNGFHETTSHYDIDKALAKEFKSKVRVDSEANQFHCYCNVKDRESITKFLTKNFPELDFKSDGDTNTKNPYFINWTAAERFCKENGLEVTMPLEAGLNNDTVGEINLIENQIADLEARKQHLVNSL
jgi:hypothetical protein